jgi:hypothetical protein
MEILLIPYVVLGLLVAWWAHSKGQNGIGTFFVSLVLSPLVGAIAVACTKRDVVKIAKRDGLRKCPQCAEYVKSEAAVCRFCGVKF